MNTETLTKDMSKVVADALTEIEARFNEVVEAGKARLEPLADTVETRTQPVREQVVAGFKSFRDQAETNGNKLADRLPAFDAEVVTPERIAERYFARAEQVLGWQRKMTFEAISNGRNLAEKAGVVDAPKPTAKTTTSTTSTGTARKVAKKATARKPAAKKTTKKTTAKKATARKPVAKKSA